MKATIKAGIGGYPFNFEEDAYNEMSNYISSLKNHFSKNEEGKEIVSDLEIRIAELLQLRVDSPSKVVSLDDVKTIMEIMGLPVDIDSEDKTGETKKEQKDDFFNPIKKRLYRNGNDTILGGVCSGFAAYFNIDTALVRIGYVLVFILSGFILPNKIRGFMFIAYIILWIVMPKAKTFKQKLSMTGGTPPSVDTIESRDEIKQTKVRGSGLLNLIKIFFGVILGLISLSLIVTLVAGIAAYLGFYGGYDFPSINTFIEIAGLNSFNFNVSSIILFSLPLIAILYLCIKLLFQSQLKKRDAVIFALGFIAWIGAGFYMGGMIGKVVANHKEKFTVSVNVPVTSTSDTLYVRLSDKYKSGVFLNHTSPAMMYFKGGKNKHSIALYPKIRVEEDSTLKTFKIEIRKIAMDVNENLAKEKAENSKFAYSVTDSLLIIEPHIYNKTKKWDGQLFEITIKKPLDKIVICKDGLKR